MDDSNDYERELRKRIAEAAGTPQDSPSPVVRTVQFFLIPLGIVAACVAVYLGIAFLFGDSKSARDWLKDLKESGGHARRMAALQFVTALGTSPEAGKDLRLVQETIEAFKTTPPDQPEVRQFLAQALGYLRNDAATSALLDTLRQDTHLETKAACLDALGTIKDRNAFPELVNLLDHDSTIVRKYAAFNLGAIGDEAAIEPLKRKLADPREEVRWNAAFALAYFLGDRSGVEVLHQMLERERLVKAMGTDEQVGRLVSHAMTLACKAAGRLKDRSFQEVLTKISRDDPSLEVRQAAHKALAELR